MTPSETLRALVEFGALFDVMQKIYEEHPDWPDERCFEAAIHDPELPSLIEWNLRKQLEQDNAA